MIKHDYMTSDRSRIQKLVESLNKAMDGGEWLKNTIAVVEYHALVGEAAEWNEPLPRNMSDNQEMARLWLNELDSIIENNTELQNYALGVLDTIQFYK